MHLWHNIRVSRRLQWLAIGTVVGCACGFAATRALGDSADVTASWQPHTPLTAAALNAAFGNLQNSIQQLEQTDCPQGYLRDTSTTSFVVCKKALDEMVRVGSGGAAFWIDRYEASIWSQPDGSGQQYGLSIKDTEDVLPTNGQYLTPLYALSVKGVDPSAWSSWFVADAACEASGKRLPTSAEWIRAARGTLDPGASTGTNGTCNTYLGTTRQTGRGWHCASRWGAEDMIGNVVEYASDWHMTPDTSETINYWTEYFYNWDTLVSIASSAIDWNAAQPGLPSVVQHGGDFLHHVGAGIFCMYLGVSPEIGNSAMGFRCVVDE